MRFRFTIRDLLWLTALVAMGIGWWLDHTNLGSQLEKLEQQAYAYKDKRDAYYEEYVALKKIAVKFASQPGNEKLKDRLRQLRVEFGSY